MRIVGIDLLFLLILKYRVFFRRDVHEVFECNCSVAYQNVIFNPYPANMENMVSQQMADGI